MSDSCDLTDCSPQGSSVYGIFQAKILEWVAISSPEDLPDPGNKPITPALQAVSLLSESPGKPQYVSLTHVSRFLKSALLSL